MNERERTNTVYYDAQSNFGTPPNGNERIHVIRKLSQPADMDDGDGYYERVHTERRNNYSYQRRDSPQKTPVMQSMVRPMGHMGSSGVIHMSPMSTSYDFSAGIAGRSHSGADRWTNENLKSGARSNSAANIDTIFNKPRLNQHVPSHLPPSAPRRDYAENSAQLMFVRRNEAAVPSTRKPKDFGVVGAYSNDPSFRADQIMYNRSGSVRQHGHDYELDPRLNVTYPQFHVDDWRERHNGASPTRNPPFPTSQNQQQRNRFTSDSNSRPIYEDVPKSASPARSDPNSLAKEKETAILDDYDNVPNEFLASEKNSNEQKEDNGSDIYQPGNYQPSEDAGSSSEDDDPEYLELMERDSIINRYEKGPDSTDIDPWENPNFDVYNKLDRFGFVHKEGEKFSEADSAQRRRILKELSREKKWLKMIEIWKSGGPSKKMMDRVWKGIPEKLRIVVWPRLLGAETRPEQKNIYAELLLRARLVSKDIKQIDLDINRTYRDHLAFRKRYDVKQKSLLNVLAAYSMYNTEVGYCQGMSQIAALFLMYLDEEASFWCLHQLMVSPKHTMHGFFVPGFPKLQRFEEHFKKVLKKYKPRIYKHLEKQDIPYIYLTKWWFGCFLDRVPFSLAMRLWDAFLVEGDTILIAMSLNIMKMHEKTIKKLTMETFMEFVQNDIANDFGYSDDETMYSLRETLTKLRSDRQHVPPPPKPEDLSEVPTKALGPVLHKSMANIREEIHEIQSRKSRANSIGRSPRPKRKESSTRALSKGPPPVVHKWNGNVSTDSITNGKDVPFEIPTRRIVGSPSSSADHYTNGHGLSKREIVSSSSSPRYHHNPNQTRSGRESATATPSTQRLRDERNGQMVLLSRGSDSDNDAVSPVKEMSASWHESKMSASSTGSTRITHNVNHVTRIELDGDVSVI